MTAVGDEGGGSDETTFPAKSFAPPARIELATFGLGNRGIPEQPREVDPARRAILGLSRRGAEALEAIATGGPGAWRVVQEVLVDLIRAGETADDDAAASGGGAR